MSVRLPSDQEIRTLHEKHSPTSAAFQLVYTHCEIVARVAERLQGVRDLRLGRMGFAPTSSLPNVRRTISRSPGPASVLPTTIRSTRPSR